MTPSDKLCFLITSQGCAGSKWVASTLNLHDEIGCSMGVDHPIISFDYYYAGVWQAEILRRNAGLSLFRYGVAGKREFYDIVRRLGMSDAFLFVDGSHADAKLHHRAFSGVESLEGAVPDRDVARLLDYIFVEMSEIVSKPILGNVHGTTATNIAAFNAQHGKQFGCAAVRWVDLIRHPLTRLESAIKATLNAKAANFIENPEISMLVDQYIERNIKEISSIERRYNISFREPRYRAALYCFRIYDHILNWTSEISRIPVTRVRLESLQQDPLIWRDLVNYLTHGRVRLSSGFLDRITSPEHLASGRISGPDGQRPPDPDEQFELWSSWERDEWRRHIERVALGDVYSPFGYRLPGAKPMLSFASSASKPAAHRFIVMTQGYTGSTWLSHALNLHEGILCTEASLHPDYSVHSKDVALRPCAFAVARRQADDKERAILTRYVAPDRKRLPIACLFEDLQEYGASRPFKALGLVHAHTLRSFRKNAQRFPQFHDPEMTMLLVVRHPLRLVETADRHAARDDAVHSYAATAIDQFLDVESTLLPPDLWRELRSQGYGINRRDAYFHIACRFLPNVADDFEFFGYTKLHFFSLEELKGNRSKAEKFVGLALGGQEAVSSGFMDIWCDPGTLSYGRYKPLLDIAAESADPWDVYAAWPNTYQRLFDHYLSLSPHSAQMCRFFNIPAALAPGGVR